jgi:hypothetical protein
MSLTERVHRHPWTSSIAVLGRARGPVAGITVAIAAAITLGACGAGLGAQKVATSSGYAPSATSARAGDRFEGPSHAALEPGGSEPAADRPGLGTSWGEAVTSPISFTSFVRSSPAPWAEVVFHYNDANGVAAHADYLGTRPAPLEIYAGDGALSVALVDNDGRALPGFTAGGRTLIMGEDGERYRIVVRNASAARFEIVASVDGLDVIDGTPADPNRRGYIVDPHGVLTIDGFRTSDDVVAAFRFGRVAESYAAQTSGDRNVGVVGMAVFAERGAAWRPIERGPAWTPAELGRRDSADPFPQRGYATPPR